jgi:hypothetical protein
MTPRELLKQVRFRALQLFIAAEGRIDFKTLERAAAKEIVAQHKAAPRIAHYATPTAGEITIRNARQVFIDRVNSIAARLAAPITPKAVGRATASKPSTVRPRPLTHRSRITEPTSAAPLTSEPPPPAANPVLIFSENTTAAVLIPDSEFHSSVLDLTTQSWRASIERNARVAEERARKRTTWVG